LKEDSCISELNFIKSFEFTPKKSGGTEDLENARKILLDVANVVSAPENPMGSPGIDPVIATRLLSMDSNLIAMPHITPRDKNKLYIYSQVMTALKLGVRNFFVIGGDPIDPAIGSKEVREIDVMETISSIKGSGRFMEKMNGGFSIGAAFNPYRKVEMEIANKKVSAGTDFFITQMIYDSTSVDFSEAVKNNIRIIPGFMPLTRKGQLKFLIKLGVNMSDSIYSRLENSEDIQGESRRIILEAYDNMKSMVSGVHVMPMGNYGLARQILECV
jgi:5,10-methylenetetrahydrofolate reductase